MNNIKKILLMVICSLGIFNAFSKAITKKASVKKFSAKNEIKQLKKRVNNLESKLEDMEQVLNSKASRKDSCPITCKCGPDCKCNPCKC